MHAVAVRVTINDLEPAEQMLRERIVPMISQSPGFKAGYWTRAEDGSNGMSMLVFESEDAARGVAQGIQEQGLDNPAVTLDSVEVREVVASA